MAMEVLKYTHYGFFNLKQFKWSKAYAVATLFACVSVVLNVLAFRKFVDFFFSTNFVCFLFCEIDAKKRVIRNGHMYKCISVCLLLLLSIGAKCFTVVASEKMAWQRKIRNVIPWIEIFYIAIVALGTRSTCNYALKHSGIGRCHVSAFENLDFYAFTPKYVGGFSFPNRFVSTMILSSISIVLWLSRILILKSSNVTRAEHNHSKC